MSFSILNFHIFDFAIIITIIMITMIITIIVIVETTPGAWGGLHTGSIAQKTNPRAPPEEKQMVTKRTSNKPKIESTT